MNPLRCLVFSLFKLFVFLVYIAPLILQSPLSSLAKRTQLTAPLISQT